MKKRIRRLISIVLCVFVVTGCLIIPTSAVKNIYLNKTSVTISVGESVILKLNGSSIKSAKSSNKKVASVNSKGKVTAKKKGKATITITGTNKKNYKCKITVKSSKNQVYNKILKEYRNAFQVDYDEFMDDSFYYYKQYPDVIQIVYWYEYMYQTYGKDLKYSFYDIDGNGTDELILGFGSKTIIDIYANSNGKAIKLFDDDKLGEKSGLDIYKSGIIRYSYVVYGPNGGGAGEGVTYYQINKGHKLKKVKEPKKKTIASIHWKSLW